MSHSRNRNRFSAATLRLLVGTMFVAGMLVTTVAASAAQGLPGMPGGIVQVPSPLEACLEVFPDGIIVGDPIVGDIDCSTIFGAPPTQEPTEVPTQEPTDVPTQEPTQEPTDVPTQAPEHHHGSKHHHGDKHEAATGGKTAPVVTTMPSTGHAMADSSNATATILAGLALVLAAIAGVTLRLTGARVNRR